MTSKECLSDLYFLAIGDENHTKKCKEIIEKDLDRLEKLEKVIKILNDKRVNVYHIWLFNDYEQYKYYHPLLKYNTEKDALSFEEFTLLKEVLYND